MRRLLLLLYVCLLLPLLGGCGASLQSDRHDVERLLLIQTMGLDRQDGRLVMSVSSGLGPDEEPALVMSASAFGIEDAIAKLQNYSPENQLFYAHVQYLLLGQTAAAADLKSVIDWVDRSPTLRMDTDMLIVRGSARDAVADTSEQATDITQRLASLERQARSTGWSVHTLREVAAALSEGLGALCLAVETTPTEQRVFTEQMQSDAVIPTGYAVLGTDGLLEFLSPEQSLGAELLTGDPAGLLITVEGDTMEVLDGSARISGRFSPNGALERIEIQCMIRTGVLEKAPGDGLEPEALDAALSETVAGWVSGALERAQATGCDYLGLRQAVLGQAPDKTGLEDGWPEIFPTVPISVAMDGRVDRSYDLAE